jgi:hypothetical protein
MKDQIIINEARPENKWTEIWGNIAETSLNECPTSGSKIGMSKRAQGRIKVQSALTRQESRRQFPGSTWRYDFRSPLYLLFDKLALKRAPGKFGELWKAEMWTEFNTEVAFQSETFAQLDPF